MMFENNENNGFSQNNNPGQDNPSHQDSNRDQNRQESVYGNEFTMKSPSSSQGRSEQNNHSGGYYQFGQNPNSSGNQNNTPSNQTPWQQPKQEYSFQFDSYSNNGAQPPKKPKKKNKGIVVFASILAGIVVMGFAVFAVYGAYNMFQNFNAPSSSDSSSAGTPANNLNLVDRPSGTSGTASDGGMVTEDIVEKIKPSVVGIQTYQGVMSFTPSSEGSGIIMSADGYIITNAHVVSGADGITVILNNGETYAGVLVGMDVKTDLAVVKIEANNLTFAEFGNSDQLKEGERVVAIGNPGGMRYAGSTSQGVISALNRKIQAQVDDSTVISLECIQTDAAINPGNSGGALINKYGQVIGINSSKLIAEGYEGIGFAIPINDAKPIIDDLIAYGRVTGRVALGISGTEVTKVLAQYNNVPMGIFISSINENSDLISKGVAAGDIITQIDGKDITTFDEISQALEGKQPGDTIKLTIFRQGNGMGGSASGKTFTVTASLIEDTSGTVGTQQKPNS